MRAVVRDSRGRAVTTLDRGDFELLDRGVGRKIATFDRDRSGVGVALLFDVSGSMDVASKTERARDLAFFLLSNLRDGEDEAAIYAFDSTLHLVQPFTSDLTALKGRALDGVAMGRHLAARRDCGRGRVDGRRRRRAPRRGGEPSSCSPTGSTTRAASLRPRSRASPAPSTCRCTSSRSCSPSICRTGAATASCAAMPRGRARWRTSPAGRADSCSRRRCRRNRAWRRAASSKTCGTRYSIAFEPGSEPGWHPLELRVRQKDHTVQARSGYVAGPTRPTS